MALRVDPTTEVILSILELDGAWNIRDLGGWRTNSGGITREGLVWRGDSLHALSPSDRDILFGQLGIRLVIDLRTREEQLINSTPTMTEVRNLNLSILPEGLIGREPFPMDVPADLARAYLEAYS